MFTVDARLLRELGERLVGRPHIALAELIKNSYDADARHVEISFEQDLIRVVDDGHGMTEQDFLERWMRIGVGEKSAEGVSPSFGRELTGSKGVGRLSAQLLAERLDLRSVGLKLPSLLGRSSDLDLADEVEAGITWPEAIKKRDLTEVEVEFDVREASSVFAAGSRHGTSIELSRLADTWDEEAFESLAREIWALQPPESIQPPDAQRFSVTLHTPVARVQETFDAQMNALMKIHIARVRGRLLPLGEAGPRAADHMTLKQARSLVDEDGELIESSDVELKPHEVRDRAALAPARRLVVRVEQRGVPDASFVVEIPDCQIDSIDFDFRVFNLNYRQGEGIKVGDARRYLNAFGGIHIYDGGFRLPYYGPDADWLKLELDHARRLSRSRLLPQDFQTRNAMLDLPSNKRVFGSARISTAAEQAAARANGRRATDALAIQITRDRLVDNLAFEQMAAAVRVSLDLYALCRARTKARGSLRKPRAAQRVAPVVAIANAQAAVESIRDAISAEDFQTLQDSLATVAEDSARQAAESKTYLSLLGALATAGMVSLSYEHEVSKQRQAVLEVADTLGRLAAVPEPDMSALLQKAADDLRSWSLRVERVRDLFGHLNEEENRVSLERYRVRHIVNDLVATFQIIAQTTLVDADGVPPDLRFPSGTYAAWSALVQNLLLNAARATIERAGVIKLDGAQDRDRSWLRVQDNGVGADLGEAERYFEPFYRRRRDEAMAAREEALGLSGSGLGLTIVRMIAEEGGATVRFIPPESGWATAIELSWKEP